MTTPDKNFNPPLADADRAQRAAPGVQGGALPYPKLPVGYTIMMTPDPEGTPLIAYDENDMFAYVAADRAQHTAQPVEVPSDFHTHKNAWRSALEMAEQNALVNPPDLDDKSYWRHEIAAFDRAYSELGAQSVEVQPLTAQQIDKLLANLEVLAHVKGQSWASAKVALFDILSIKPTSSEGGETC